MDVDYLEFSVETEENEEVHLTVASPLSEFDSVPVERKKDSLYLQDLNWKDVMNKDKQKRYILRIKTERFTTAVVHS